MGAAQKVIDLEWRQAPHHLPADVIPRARRVDDDFAPIGIEVLRCFRRDPERYEMSAR